jgi:hypothetical protein
MLGALPLQIVGAEGVAVIAGFGLTVTVMVVLDPMQEPVVAVGVTIYFTVPEIELLGSVSVWLMVEPLPDEAPVIPWVIVPIVHVNELGVLAVRLMLGPVPLQVLAVVAVVTAGVGFTVTVMG